MMGAMMTPEKVAYQAGQSFDEWRKAEDILGPHWFHTWETVAHLAAHGNMSPARVAEILVGRSGFPGLIDLI